MIPSPVEQYIWSAARWILNLADVGQSGRIWPRVLEKIPMHFLHCIHPASTFKWKEASSCKPDLDNHLKKCHICWEAWPHLLNNSISQKQQNFPEAQQTPAIESVTGADCKLSYRVAVIPNVLAAKLATIWRHLHCHIAWDFAIPINQSLVLHGIAFVKIWRRKKVLAKPCLADQ